LADRLIADSCTELQKMLTCPTVKLDLIKWARFWLCSSDASAVLQTVIV